MRGLNPETAAAIQGDEFARRTIECARLLIYAEHRDWQHLSRSGKLMFDCDEAATTYAALSHLLGTAEPPDVGDMKVNVGSGTMLSASAVDALQSAFAKGA